MTQVPQWIRESNLIESVNEREADAVCTKAYRRFLRRSLTLKNVLALHGEIMAGRKIYGDYHPEWIGALRNVDVWVGGRVCPNWQQVPGLILNWFSVWALADTEESVRQAHIEFERVHPFADGNGRVGRMVMNWQRHKIGLPPANITWLDRWEYYGWFQ